MTDKKKPKLILENSDDDSSISSETFESKDNNNKLSSFEDLTNNFNNNPINSKSISSSTPIPSESEYESESETKTSSEIISDTNLEQNFKNNNCDNELNYYKNECNKFLLKKELIEREDLLKTNEFEYLYPNLNDINFNIKIATKKEFNDTKYEGPNFNKSIKEQADILANSDFELAPHQAFIKNYLSFQTPYSSLLLYHGLGSGKTCSAIGVCEEMRDYMKQIGTSKRIIIVASENVQDNFKLQLFNERNLKQFNGIWTIRGCTGNKLLKEINPMNMPMSKDKVISQIKNLINTYYIFLGYVQFANYIIKTMNYEEEIERKRDKIQGDKTKIQMLKDVKVELNSRIIKRLRNEFDNRLVVIDEVHNIRKTDENENKKVAINLELLIKSALNMRFLLLSATPMYNNYKEIVWLLNLMNTNDRRGRIDAKNIFDKNGNFKNGGEELLIRKATGYISFVRGENPYTFPYRIYPSEFAKKNTFPGVKYPSRQMNLKKIHHEDQKRILSLYLTKIGGCDNCGKCQYCCYKYIIHNLRNKQFKITTKYGVIKDMPSFENMESFGYTLLQTPLESLIISYPVPGLKKILDKIPDTTMSKEFAPSFSESTPTKEEDTEEEEEYIFPIGKKTKPSLIVKSSSTERKSSGEEITESSPEEYVLSKKQTSSKVKSSSPEEYILSKSYKKGGKESSSVEYKGSEFSIDPHQLTGKIGLERMMKFVDSKSPPTKGEFEYKKSTLDNYGKIFSSKEIGNYSSKIKTILDNIYNKETNKVSDGIILIYSQYIDSGLIPVALALEEMGFTRYGQSSIKPLFKNRPSEVVDVRTMQPPEDKKKFMPARYSMITGDPRLSPNNDFEVKGVTGEDNKDGNKIKVILISKAGSEGIDLKFIRQVHIIDPWYNMNRPEQIIGRAVRNFSHKDLPFEKRNVQIFMYGTILDNNVEEAADLYVYRVAEYKAIQIGKVTRVLKETAIDCIINHAQTQFTQDEMTTNSKELIIQELSTGEILNNYKIGDSPFSPSCDYMADCNFNCRPDSIIDESKLNEDTYDERFIIMNSEKILQRIRMIYKEAFFYKKDTLFKAIRTPKEYPYIQIYSALTQLIEDENEFIVDKYGRNGRLINIGEYYLFQPLELKNKNITIFERSTPLDYKHNSINFELKQDIVKQVIDKRNLTKELIENKKEKFLEGNKIIDEMKKNYNLAMEFTKEQRVPRGDDDWYKHCGIVIKKMSKDYPESRKYLLKILVAHMIELLVFEDKINIMNYIYSIKTESIKKGSFELYVREYFQINSIETSKFTSFIMYKLNKRIIMILDEENKWIEATPEDQREIAMKPETKEFLSFNKDDYNKIIGFMGYKKGNKDLAFKTKNMDSKRDTGAICQDATKDKNLKKINDIIREEKYTIENTKIIKDKDGNIIKESIGNTELCVLEEYILRYFNYIEENNKKWVLTPEMAIYHKLYTIFI